MHTTLSRLSLVAALGTLLLLMTVRASAQPGGDPNAIELRPYVTIIDSADKNLDNRTPWNVGDLNGDGIDDVLQYVPPQTGEWGVSRVPFLVTGHSFEPLDTIHFFNTGFVADWDGDGRMDISDWTSDNLHPNYVHRGIARKPYFDTARPLPLNVDAVPLLVADLDGDSIPDLLASSSSASHLLRIYRGPLLSSDTLIAVDSIRFNADNPYEYLVDKFVGKFTPDGKKRLLTITSWQREGREYWHWSIAAKLYPPMDGINRLGDATPSLIYYDTANASVFVYTRPVAVGDVTGDGLDDLLIADSSHVYVFAGGPNFGTHTFAKSEADLVLSAPPVIDTASRRYTDYPDGIQIVGDLTGMGIPYFVVGATQAFGSTNKHVLYFYAAGGAMDPYYDATYTSPDYNYSNIAPLHFPHSTGLIFTEQEDTSGTELDLLLNGLENLPHAQRSGVKQSVIPIQRLALQMDENAVLNVILPERDTHVQVYNAIGASVLDIPDCRHALQIRTGAWPHGAYTVVADGMTRAIAKFIR